MSWRKYFRRAQWDAERGAEMEAHLQHEVDERVAAGMTRENIFGEPSGMRSAARRWRAHHAA